MKQAIMTSPGTIAYQEVASPESLKPDEVLLKVRRIGVCGSDIHVFHGEHPATPYPVVQGHEYSGVVVSVGSSVTTIKAGMLATGLPQLTCGVCAPCQRGQYNVCNELKVQGFQAPGVAQEYFVLQEDRVVPFPDSMTLEQGAMIEPCAVGAHATKRVDTLYNRNVIVSGAGTIGNLVAQFARARGAKKVLITDLSDFRLQKAKDCGIEYTLNLMSTSFEDGVKQVFGDEGFQVGFEAAGVEASLTNLVSNVEKGGYVVIIGVYAKNPTVNMFHLGEHELNVLGSMMYRKDDYEEAVKLISMGKIILEPLISHHVAFDRFLDAYRLIEKRQDKIMKVMVDL